MRRKRLMVKRRSIRLLRSRMPLHRFIFASDNGRTVSLNSVSQSHKTITINSTDLRASSICQHGQMDVRAITGIKTLRKGSDDGQRCNSADRPASSSLLIFSTTFSSLPSIEEHVSARGRSSNHSLALYWRLLEAFRSYVLYSI